ncbi:ATP-binding protein [Faecalibacillus intestinalis]|uniref:histidine kinase n=1 Tax=Faecalibacillus intestinalis TaxID=1982626 RepID=A0AAW4VFM6_9FIRM|nr:ATP-binding protein [Faecalibacillus intestinalis]MCB8562325.1 response regulator [Faecalibacillus intestinalis]MCG4810383.1 ATP-binding protein [Faecalibacillus intestinalis]
MNKEEVVQLNKLKRKTGLFFIIVMGVMLICFNFLIQFEVNKEKISASYTAEDTVRKIETQLGRYLENSEMFKNIISSKHTISDEQFNQLASYMKKNKNVIEAYELAPNGIIEKAYPLKGNEKVIGMNTLELPERQKEANIARKSGEYTIAGPYELKQGGTGALLFDPIYINDGNEKKFWGFSILVLNWDAFLEELEVDKLEDATYHFKVWKEGNKGKHVIIMSCGHSSLNHTLSVACEVPNDTWYFEIVPFQGWIPMSYKIFGSIVSVLVAILLSMGYWQIILRREKEAVYAKQIEKVATEAQHANQAKTRFLFNMSHDIRTPMNAIIGYTQLLENNLDNKKQALDYILKLKSSSTILLSLINYILEMTQIESGKLDLKKEIGDLDDLVKNINVVVEPLIKEKKLHYSYHLEIKHHHIICDKTKLREIVLNILSNAIKYTPEGGNIELLIQEISFENNKVKYHFIIIDNGIGMKEDFLPHIFEEFAREKTSTESKVPGVGLGLPIVKSLIDMMNGTIQVESKLNKGTKFTVELSFLTSLQVENVNERNTSTLDFSGKHILLVEDNELNAEIGIELLNTFKVIIDLAKNGEECIKILEKMPEGYYDLILMDIQMPIMDGYEATKIIRSFNNKNAQIPIIAMTANAFEEDRKHALQLGMNEHLAKPVDIEKLKDVFTKYFNHEKREK